MSHLLAEGPTAVHPPSLARRRIAGWVAAAAAAAFADRVFGAATSHGRRPDLGAERLVRTFSAFSAFCDTIVPADEMTPSATALGVDRAILDDVQADALALRLLAAGCAWLDDETGGDFAAADEARRVASVVRMTGQPWQSPVGRFYAVMRNSVFAAYYVQPAAWRGLALDRPPQPLGFFDAIR